MKLFYCKLLLLILLPLYSEAVDCPTLPDNITLENAFKTLLASQGGEGDPANVFIQDGTYYTCQVQGTTNGTYQEVAVIMTYTTSTDSTTQIGQCVMDCVGSGNNVGWDGRSNSFEELSSSVDYMNIPLFTNCGRCTKDANNENYCQACHSDCNIGLMRCTGTSSSDCCVAFETNGECIPDLNCDQNNFVANEQNNFFCACGLSSCGDGYFFNSTFCNCDLTDICQADNPCANEVCMLVSSPDQYTCNCTGTDYMGTNCSECKTCLPGYSTMDYPNCACNANHICTINNPCQNGRDCIIQNGENNYTCDCGYYSEPNCTVCTLECSNVTIVDDSCTMCLDSICITDNPCDNNGICSLNDNGVYQCDCGTSNYSGVNCTACDLQCQNGATVINSCTCVCTTGYTGTVCDSVIDYCENNNCGLYGSCVNLPDMATHECSCNEGWEGPTCSQCTISNCEECTGNPPVCVTCQENYAVSASGCVCEQDVCRAPSPCKNNGTYSFSQGSYQCLCTAQWSGVNCTECADNYGMDARMDCVACGNRNCMNCSDNYLTCIECKGRYSVSTDGERCEISRSAASIASISISAIIGIIVLLLLIVIIVYVIYAIYDGRIVALRKLKIKNSKIFGESHDNPMYVNPDEIDSERM